MESSTGTSPGQASKSAAPAAGLYLTALLLAPDVEARQPKESVSVEAVYTGEVWRNVSGGAGTGSAYLDNLDLTAELDADLLWGWSGTRMFLYGLYNNGNALSPTKTGDEQTVSNIESGANDFRIYEAWLDTPVGDGGSLRLGLYDLNSEFDVLDSAGVFLHSAHGIGTDIGQTGRNGPSIFPVTSLALRLAWDWGNHWAARAAVLDAVPGAPDRAAEMDVHLSSKEGALLVTEVERDLPAGRLLAGAWGYTARFDQWPERPGDPATPRDRGNRGIYLRGEWQPGEGVALFGRYGHAAGEYNPTAHFYGAGVHWQGPWRGRPEDALGFAVAWAEASSQYRDAMGVAGHGVERREVALELTYRMVLGDRLVIQPDLQYVANPGFDPALDDAVAVGLRVQFQLL